MDFGRLLLRPFYWLAEKILGTWARPVLVPESPAELFPDADVPVCYVFETGGLADTLAFERIARKHGLASPTDPFELGDMQASTRIVVLRGKRGLLLRRPDTDGSARLRSIVDASLAAGGAEVSLVPVAIYWGRSPGKEASLLQLMFSENWGFAGRTRKLLTTVFQGRHTLLSVSKPMSLAAITHDKPDPELAFRKVSRILRVHFRQRRIATVGPDLSHRRTLANAVLGNPQVQQVIDNNVGHEPARRQRQLHEACDYIDEIAAHISYPTIRAVERVLSLVWNRIYDGIILQHADRLQELANDKEIVYVPCHRSHFDYLLLGYTIYHEGLSLPHVAAGINLNLPLVGNILRRGGAFFLRRSFRGNRLYAAVFSAYLHEILVRGHPIEYFVEGGRSRTGRLLDAKGGMLAMTVSSYLREPRRPIVFVPVYFGYEKLIEGDSFINELGGAKKSKESLFGLLRSVRALRGRFGKVYVNVGVPIAMEAVLDDTAPGWRDRPRTSAERPPWINSVIDDLGARIMTGINSAAAVTPVSLLAVVLLATPKQTMGYAELCRQLRVCIDLLNRFRYSKSVTLPDTNAEEICTHGIDMGLIEVTDHDLGDVVSMSQKNAVLMTYFRNNILHLFALPASVACCFIQGRRLEHAELQRLVRLIYPFLQKELTLEWDSSAIDAVTTRAIESLVELDLLARGRSGKILIRPPSGSASAFQLLMLGQLMVPMLQRFYLVITQLVKTGSGVLTRTELEKRCQKSAERLSMIYGLHSPDFFDRNLFQDFISELRRLEVLRKNGQGKLEFDDDITDIGEDARLVLGEEIRHSILSLTFADQTDDNIPDSIAI